MSINQLRLGSPIRTLRIARIYAWIFAGLIAALELGRHVGGQSASIEDPGLEGLLGGWGRCIHSSHDEYTKRA